MPGSSAPDHPPMLGAVQVVPPRSLRSLRGLHLDRPCASANLARMEEPGNNEHPSDQLDLRDNPASIKPGAVQTYHRRRRQRSLGKLTPIEFELLHQPVALAA